MPDTSSSPVELYRARNLVEANTLHLALETEGISTIIENESLQIALGEVSLGWSTAPKLLVSLCDETAAREILEKFLRRQRDRDNSVTPLDLACLACGEPMGKDVVCRKCGWSYREAGDSSVGETEPDQHESVPSTSGVNSEFFRGWRRKVGLATLAIAMLLMLVWMRSYVVCDQIVIPSTNSLHTITLVCGRIIWDRWLDYSDDQPGDWNTYDPVTSNDHPWDDLDVDWKHQFAGIQFGAGTFTVDTITTRTALWVIPYWSLVLPLTLLSAWLILGKRRKAMVASYRLVQIRRSVPTAWPSIHPKSSLTRRASNRAVSQAQRCDGNRGHCHESSLRNQSHRTRAG